MERHSFNLVYNLSKSYPINITLVHTTFDGNNPDIKPLFEASQLAKITEVFIPFPKGGNYPGHYLKQNKDYSNLVVKKLGKDFKRFNVIYCKGFTSWCIKKELLKQNLKTPLWVNFHGYEMFQKPASFKHGLQMAMLKPFVKSHINRADKVISYGGKITQLLQNLPVNSSKIIELPGAVDNSWIASSIQEKSDQVTRFFFLGRYERRKGVEELSNVLSKMRFNSKMEFHFIGPIPNEKHINKPDVYYHGKITDKETLLSLLDSFDVLVCPSWSEGMPNVIMEAMARFNAVIATDVGANNTLVSNKNGGLLPIGNKEILEQEILRIAQLSVSELADLQLAAHKAVKNVAWNKVAELTWSALLKHGKT